MKKYQFIIRTNEGDQRPVLSQGAVDASRTAVALRKIGERIPDTTKREAVYHVSFWRVS